MLALVSHSDQFLDNHLLLESQVVLLFVEVVTIGVELLTQDGQRTADVALLEYGMAG